MSKLLDTLFSMEGASNAADKSIRRAPFGWPGGKSKSVKNIIPLLPETDRYVEAYGGSGVVMFNRKPSKLEVFNDKHSGITSFYRCLSDPDLFNQLIERLEATVHSREEFAFCKDTWENANSHVERAARWYYMVRYSFSQLGRNFGRATNPRCRLAGAIRSKLPDFAWYHQRLNKVQIENRDALLLLREYDHPETVFYLDPPYINAYKGTYAHELSDADHNRLLETIAGLKGFVALSGFPNQLYDSFKWDATYTWDAFSSVHPVNAGEGNRKEHIGDVATRDTQVEYLWIKEANE